MADVPAQQLVDDVGRAVQECMQRGLTVASTWCVPPRANPRPPAR